MGDVKHYLVYKYKEYDLKENIINQGKTEVQVYNRNDAQVFMEAIGYKELIHVIDSMIIYEKDGLELCVQHVNGKYLYIEIEESEQYNTVEKMIKALEKTNIDYDKSNYFAKKAKVILEDNIKDNN